MCIFLLQNFVLKIKLQTWTAFNADFEWISFNRTTNTSNVIRKFGTLAWKLTHIHNAPTH